MRRRGRPQHHNLLPVRNKRLDEAIAEAVINKMKENSGLSKTLTSQSSELACVENEESAEEKLREKI